MNLKNYSSSVPVETTIARIEQYLIGTGLVSGIGKRYANGVTTSIVFEIKYKEDRLPLTVKLEAKVKDCQKFFWRDYCATARRGRKTEEDFLEQAARTAWRLQEDDVRIQTSLILLKQKTVVEAFMANVMVDGEQTWYQKIEGAGFKQLAAPSKE